MEKLVDYGLVKTIDISNVSSAQVEQLAKTARIKPVINQVECHPALPQTKLLQTYKQHGIQMMAYSPLVGSPVPHVDGSLVTRPIRVRLLHSESELSQWLTSIRRHRHRSCSSSRLTVVWLMDRRLQDDHRARDAGEPVLV